jgi:hypothetical protein
MEKEFKPHIKVDCRFKEEPKLKEEIKVTQMNIIPCLHCYRPTKQYAGFVISVCGNGHDNPNYPYLTDICFSRNPENCAICLYPSTDKCKAPIK